MRQPVPHACAMGLAVTRPATRPHCLSLSDRQRALIQSAAASIPVERREAFLKQLAGQLRGQPSDTAVAAAINIGLDRVHAFDNSY